MKNTMCKLGHGCMKASRGIFMLVLLLALGAAGGFLSRPAVEPHLAPHLSKHLKLNLSADITELQVRSDATIVAVLIDMNRDEGTVVELPEGLSHIVGMPGTHLVLIEIHEYRVGTALRVAMAAGGNWWGIDLKNVARATVRTYELEAFDWSALDKF